MGEHCKWNSRAGIKVSLLEDAYQNVKAQIVKGD